MFKKERPKDPKKVAAGQVAHRKLTAGMNASEYRGFQQRCRKQALARHPTMQQVGAEAANRAQREEWGSDDYIEQRKAAYQRCVEKHGATVATAAVRRTTLQRRLERLHNPTRGEAAIRALLEQLGFTVHLDTELFDYTRWRLDPLDRMLDPRDAFAEGGVGSFFSDVLLPVLGVAIEVEGGIHVLNRERDTRRRAYLEAHGLRVIVIPDTADQPLDLVAVVERLAPYFLTNHLLSRRNGPPDIRHGRKQTGHIRATGCALFVSLGGTGVRRGSSGILS